MTTTLYHLILKVPKEHSAFLYFTLEANEGLGFYSTLQHKVGDLHRLIDIKGPSTFKSEVNRLINKLAESFPIEFILNQEIEDEIKN